MTVPPPAAAQPQVPVDVVHLNYLCAGYRTWANVPGAPPYIATAWGSDLNDEVFRRPPEHTRSMKQILQSAAAITADSHQLLGRAQMLTGDRVPRKLVLWGVDLDVFSRDRVREDAARWRGELGIDPAQSVVLSPRQTLAHYHPDEILRGFATSQWAKNGVLLFKCYDQQQDTAYVDELKTLVQSMGLDNRVRFVPPCAYERVPGLYSLADVAVSALSVDGFPSTFSELFALGVPLVATNLPGYASLLENERNALLFEPGDHYALTRAFDRLFGDASLRERLRQEGQAFAMEKANFQRTIDAFESLYHGALETKRLRT